MNFNKKLYLLLVCNHDPPDFLNALQSVARLNSVFTCSERLGRSRLKQASKLRVRASSKIAKITQNADFPAKPRFPRFPRRISRRRGFSPTNCLASRAESILSIGMISHPVALVTGAGRGLGSALARHLAQNGFAVALHYRTSQAGAEALQQELTQAQFIAETFPGALEKAEEAEALVAAIVGKWGRLDVVIHNSGQYDPTPLAELTAQQWQVGLDSTLNAAFHTTQAALPYLRKRGGRLIFIGDSSCERATARNLAMGYHIGKTGILMLARSYAQSEGRCKITANCVSPGYLDNSVELIDLDKIPAGRYGTFTDLWNAVEFLLKPESDYINGAHLVITGGWNLR